MGSEVLDGYSVVDDNASFHTTLFFPMFSLCVILQSCQPFPPLVHLFGFGSSQPSLAMRGPGPDIVDATYESDKYEGEGVLHMAIVHAGRGAADPMGRVADRRSRGGRVEERSGACGEEGLAAPWPGIDSLDFPPTPPGCYPPP